MIDWTMAGRIAGGVAGGGPPTDPATGRLPELTAEAAEQVCSYTGLEPATEIPAAEVVDRDGWTELNLRGMRPIEELLDPAGEGSLPSLLGPASAPLGAVARAAVGPVVTVELGLLTGYLARRVLGQYEASLLDPTAPTRLVYVGPNLSEAIEQLDAETDGLLRWVALHEVTHAVQFAAVPWLREYLSGKVTALLAASTPSLPNGDRLRGLMADPAQIGRELRDGGLFALVAGPAQRAILEDLQSAMAIVEGYAEHVMDAVGAQLDPEISQLRQRLDRRRESRGLLETIVAHVLGLEMKMRQYRLGKQFCDAVVAAEGIEGLNHVWSAAGALPSSAEIDHPGRWMERVAGERATAA
ncbi:MAG: zinc-dependent metalloprotease [Solirubrobacterales bacterium]